MQMAWAMISFSWGRLEGSRFSMLRMSWRRSGLYLSDIGANVPLMIFNTKAGRFWRENKRETYSGWAVRGETKEQEVLSTALCLHTSRLSEKSDPSIHFHLCKRPRLPALRVNHISLTAASKALLRLASSYSTQPKAQISLFWL